MERTPRRPLVRKVLEVEPQPEVTVCAEASQNGAENKPTHEEELIELKRQVSALELQNSKLEHDSRFGVAKLKSSNSDI